MPDEIDPDLFDAQVCEHVNKALGLRLTPLQVRAVSIARKHPVPTAPDLTAAQVQDIKVAYARALYDYRKAQPVVHVKAPTRWDLARTCTTRYGLPALISLTTFLFASPGVWARSRGLWALIASIEASMVLLTTVVWIGAYRAMLQQWGYTVQRRDDSNS